MYSISREGKRGARPGGLGLAIWRCVMLAKWWPELREVLWLTSVVGVLSAFGVLLAVAVAITSSV
jgi:hypothetical protein